MLRSLVFSLRSTTAYSSRRQGAGIILVRRGLADKAAAATEKDKQAADTDPLKSAKELNYNLLDRELKSLDKFVSLVLNTPADEFNYVNSSSALYRLGRLMPEIVEPQKPSFEVAKAAKKLAQVAQGHVQQYGPREASKMMFGIAVGLLDRVNPNLFDELIGKVSGAQASKLSEYSMDELRNVAWSLAKIGKGGDMVKAALNEAAARKLDGATSKDVSDLAWTMAQSQVKDQTLLQLLTARLSSEGALKDFASKELAQLVWSFAKLEHKNDALLNKIVEEVRTRGGFSSGDFALQRMSQLVWGLAVLGHKDEELLKDVLRTTSRKLKYLPAQSKKDLEFAFWTFKSDDFEKQLAAQKAFLENLAAKKARVTQQRDAEFQKRLELVQQKQKAAQAAADAKKAATTGHATGARKHHH